MAYVSRAELRALNGLGDSAVHTDADLDIGVLICKEIVDEFTGTSFGDITTPAYDAFSVTVDGEGSDVTRAMDDDKRPVMFIRTIDTVTIGGVLDAGYTYQFDKAGYIKRSSGTFTAGVQNVVITGTAGRTSTPVQEIRWAARSIARNWILNLHSNLPDRIISGTSAEGSFEVRAQAGSVGRPTAMPDINAALNNHRHRWDLG